MITGTNFRRNPMSDPMLIETEGTSMLQSVRSRKLCDSTCPVFDTCLIMPLSVKPKEPKKRTCLVNASQPDIRMAYLHLALGGEDELVDEIQRHFLGYLKEFNDLEEALNSKKQRLSVKDRVLLLSHRDKIMSRLTALYRTKYGEKLTVRKDDHKVQPIRVHEIFDADSRRSEPRLIMDKTPPTQEEVEKFEELEQKAFDKAKPDKESLVHSTIVKEKVLPSMIVVPVEAEVVKEKKPGVHPVIAKFFSSGDDE
jgi:hypothetical protein